VISTSDAFNKDLVTQHKSKPRITRSNILATKKKKNKGPKPTQTTSAPNGDNGEKSKNKKTDRHCNFCGKDCHDESKCFKKMVALEVAMKKPNISIDSTSSSSSHGHKESHIFCSK
jgi:hypothetical protein